MVVHAMDCHIKGSKPSSQNYNKKPFQVTFHFRLILFPKDKGYNSVAFVTIMHATQLQPKKAIRGNLWFPFYPRSLISYLDDIQRLGHTLYDLMAIKKLATMKSMSYQTLIRHWLAEEIKKELKFSKTWSFLQKLDLNRQDKNFYPELQYLNLN